jgi:GNAT superfamily N-acetyltransferase
LRVPGKTDGDILEIALRRATHEDREKLIEVESKSTPNLSYVNDVFDMFVSDEIGEFGVAEADGEVVACGKYTVVPDGSVWLETLRVIPERQGIGIGKRFYERWLDIARRQGVTTMRMYTGVRNVVSKGLAERYGLRLAETFRGAHLPCRHDASRGSTGSFRCVTDPERATSLLMPLGGRWRGFHVMNRTFHRLTPALCVHLAKKGMVYEDPATRSVITLGARFQPKKMLHIGVFGGDAEDCLGFALEEGLKRRVERLNCDFPASAADVQDALTEYGFGLTPSGFIVMEVHLDD